MNGQCLRRGSWIVHRLAILAAAVCLPVGVSWADGGGKEKSATPVKKKMNKGEAVKFDVIVHGTHVPKEKAKRGRPVAIVLAFEDGSTQKVDISKHDRVTVDVTRQQVLLHTGDVTAAFVAAPHHGHAHAAIAGPAPAVGTFQVPLPPPSPALVGKVDGTASEHTFLGRGAVSAQRLDGDGDLDLHLAGHGSIAAAARNDGTGHFTYIDPAIDIPRGVREHHDIPYPGGEIRLAFDFDEDRKSDILASWHDGGGVLYLNDSRPGDPPTWNFKRPGNATQTVRIV